MNQPYSDMRPPGPALSRLEVRPMGEGPAILAYRVPYGPTYPVWALTAPKGFLLLDYGQPLPSTLR